MGKPKTSQSKKPLLVEAYKGETETESMARVMVEPYLRHGAVTSALSDKMIGKLPGDPQFHNFGNAIKAKAQPGCDNQVKLASEMLMAQAHSLDAIFTEYARRGTNNLGEFINASERYMRVALKAQAGSRAALEALIRLHQPREQTVKHVHVNEGAQAVVADHVHVGGGENGKSIKQSHATETAGDQAALSGPDPEGNGVPIPSRHWEAAMQNARGHESGGAQG
jgi:hypothetical protein